MNCDNCKKEFEADEPAAPAYPNVLLSKLCKKCMGEFYHQVDLQIDEIKSRDSIWYDGPKSWII